MQYWRYSVSKLDSILTKRVLLACYVILAVGLVAYLALSLPLWVIYVADAPGLVFFLVLFTTWPYRDGGEAMVQAIREQAFLPF
jgi:hypothetical protein